MVHLGVLFALSAVADARRYVQGCFLLSLGVHIAALLVDQVANHVQTLTKASCVQRIVSRHVF